MKKQITKETLAKVVNTRFPRIANYLKKLNKTTNIKDNHLNVAVTIALHKIFFNTITTKEINDYLIEYLENNYIKEYITLVEEDITLEDLKEIIDTIYTKFNNDKISSIKDNNKKVYEAIQKEYKSIEIVE